MATYALFGLQRLLGWLAVAVHELVDFAEVFHSLGGCGHCFGVRLVVTTCMIVDSDPDVATDIFVHRFSLEKW